MRVIALVVADNVLYYGDNLDILRRYVADESVDLVYLDPPFNSNATYNVLFAEQDGTQAASQITPSRTRGAGIKEPSAPIRRRSRPAARWPARSWRSAPSWASRT